MRTVRRFGGKEDVAEEEDGEEDEGEDGEAGEGKDSRRGRREGHDGDEAFAQAIEKARVREQESEGPSGYERDGKNVGGREANMGSFYRKKQADYSVQ